MKHVASTDTFDSIDPFALRRSWQPSRGRWHRTAGRSHHREARISVADYSDSVHPRAGWYLCLRILSPHTHQSCKDAPSAVVPMFSREATHVICEYTA
ncbi:hypothetical protein LAUMK13_01664 [Mycobacterium innocens]|uniref:Uncharacterized protein n=1 Tax=Mycobacterium innocens TaxID=2341083 RepID=A0A498PZL2_9MYCO|nr:hypothetical protein LAUMK13_01664 [Mycobacterium innocens]